MPSDDPDENDKIGKNGSIEIAMIKALFQLLQMI